MENYKKLHRKPVDELPKGPHDIFISSGSKLKTVISRSVELLEEVDGKVVLIGCGPTVNKTITCAEIIKRQYQTLHQNNKLFYKRMEDVWEPNESIGLDKLTVTRNVPSMKITLSKAPLESSDPGYQAPLNRPKQFPCPQEKKTCHSHSKNKQSYDELSKKPNTKTPSSSFQRKEKFPKSKRFKSM
ncbi:ribonuclease P protein subunit p25-like protein isoform X1 [Xenia sp. Carnegie-2017]|uniref:ribonuclease P protein subunit p25-like protein isoform X1 n=1 Tax=Xenia sp. Carnegie-2017 TaxID=2897299 RepID=UPI001F037D57|nr:ribonuclease P protein subunit p25-like protein isoform X1 [Xenia sp. Carnegie-2017]